MIFNDMSFAIFMPNGKNVAAKLTAPAPTALVQSARCESIKNTSRLKPCIPKAI